MPQGYELNLRDYWNIFLKRKWIIIFFFSIIAIVTVIYTNLQPFVYKAVAIVKIEEVVGFSKVFPQPYYWQPIQLDDYAQQIKSLPIIEEAVKASGLLDKNASQQEVDNLIGIISSSVSTRTIEKTNMIQIELVSEDPKKAATIINKIVEAFKSENINQKNQQVRNVREFIEQQLERVSATLKETEEKLNELTLKGVGALATSITNKILEMESKRSDLLTKFTELHPDVAKIDEQLSLLREQLKNLPKEEFEFSNLNRDVAINERLYNTLRERLQEVQIKESEKVDNIVLVSPAVTPQFPFSPNKPGNYTIGIVLGIILGASVGLVFEHLDTSIGRIEDLESITKISVIGVIPYFSLRSKESKEDIKKSKRFFWRTVNKEERLGRLQIQLITAHRESSIFLEAFRILGANVQVVFGQGDKIKGKCILITSSNPQEGKSIIASNLGIIMAQMGYRTVLIDTDLRRSSVHKIFGLKQKEKGITDILTGEIELEAAVRTTTDLLMGEMSPDDLLKNPWMDSFHLITAGTTFPNSPYLLNTERMDRLLKDLKERYDVVLMDSSPVLAVSDTFIIVPKTDGVIIVYRAGATSRISLRRAKTQVESAKNKGIIKGIILNNVTPEASVDTYYYYYRRRYYTQNGTDKGEA